MINLAHSLEQCQHKETLEKWEATRRGDFRKAGRLMSQTFYFLIFISKVIIKEAPQGERPYDAWKEIKRG